MMIEGGEEEEGWQQWPGWERRTSRHPAGGDGVGDGDGDENIVHCFPDWTIALVGNINPRRLPAEDILQMVMKGEAVRGRAGELFLPLPSKDLKIPKVLMLTCVLLYLDKSL